jgi:pyrroline-5-carboxylate reductase
VTRTLIGFLGAGNMAEALIRGLLETQVCDPSEIFASDPNAQRLAFISGTYGIQSAADNSALVKSCPVLVLAVKPQQVAEVMSGLRGEFDPGRNVLISIAAGISTGYLERALDVPAKVVRVMPNLPVVVRAGAGAFCLGRYAGPAEAELAHRLFASVSLLVPVEETLLDAVTAVSGSGPAYVFYLCELMTAAGVELGLTPADAERLSVQTVIGAARMLSEGRRRPADLRQAVTSKGGTTEAALAHLAAGGWPQIFTDALRAARDRARELTPPAPER